MIVISTWPTLSRRELYSTWSPCLIQLSLIMTSPTGRVPILHWFLYSRYVYSKFGLKLSYYISYFYNKAFRRSNKKWTRSWLRQFSITAQSRMISGQRLRLRSNQRSVRYIRKSYLFWPFSFDWCQEEEVVYWCMNRGVHVTDLGLVSHEFAS